MGLKTTSKGIMSWEGWELGVASSLLVRLIMLRYVDVKA